jgi:predicted RND superfamily exporter protein
MATKTLIYLLGLGGLIALIIVKARRARRKEIVANIDRLTQLLSAGQVTSNDKRTIENFVNGKTYDKQKFENYVSQAINIKKHIDAMVNKYGEEIGWKLLKQEYWVGMTKEQLVDANGEPTQTETEVLKTKTKETLIYGNKSSGDYFVFENGIATKIVDR